MGLRTVKQRYKPIEWRKKWRLVGGRKDSGAFKDKVDVNEVEVSKTQSVSLDTVMPHESSKSEVEPEPDVVVDPMAFPDTDTVTVKDPTVDPLAVLCTETDVQSVQAIVRHHPSMCMYMLKSACLLNRCGMRMRVRC